ncbi:MAG: YdjY domain-containing protein, partial [Gemmataceae bacterium]
LLIFLLALGCDGEVARPPVEKAETEPKPAATKKVNVGQNIWLEVLPGGKRQVVVSAQVCLTEGPLELFLTRKGTKEHEAVLAAEVDARKLHEALILAEGVPGQPVRFDPKFTPPSGSKILVTVTYPVKGGSKTVRAQEWVRSMGTKAELATDWVFAGSVLAEDPFTPNGPKRYLANEGDIVAVSNFETAMLDLPIESSKADDSRGYEAWTERLPERGTKVSVTFTPVKEKK